MKKLMNRLIHNEEGQAAILALILLLVSGLIIAPLLNYMAGGITVGAVMEKRMDELYAADSGVEDAMWRIITKTDLPVSPDPWPDPAPSPLPTQSYTTTDVNGKPVAYSITFLDPRTIKIVSDGGDVASKTTIETYINIVILDLFGDNAITSRGDIELQPGTTVNGDVQYNGNLDNKGVINGETKTEPVVGWPTEEVLTGYYWNDVDDAPTLGISSIDVKDYNASGLGPVYRDGSLTIDCTKKNQSLNINGTVYVNGDVTFLQTGLPKEYTIFLNGQTIFVDGNLSFPSGRVSIAGSGCIIATGDITFQPSMSSNPNDFVFVMSANGTVNFQPQGNFYGSLAGDVSIDLQPGSSLTWPSPRPDDLNFPGEKTRVNVISAIRTWEINVQ